MANILWIMNKYVGREKAEEFYPYFLSYTQQELEKKGHQLSFIFFSDLLANNKRLNNKFVFKTEEFLHLSKKEIDAEAKRIEKEYEFTFKQAYFADIIQTFRGQNGRKITVPEKYFDDLSFLVPQFLFLEQLILSQNFDVIFSDVSSEAEMEFGRVIGRKHNKLVFKTYEGSALGHTVILNLLGFGKDEWIEVSGDFDWTIDDAKHFCEEFIGQRKLPYTPYSTLIPQINFFKRIQNIRKIHIRQFPSKIFGIFKSFLKKVYYFIERNVIKPILYDHYDSTVPNLFMGFHLNQESTMVLRSQPFTNQIALVEMISRVLPYNYVLYVREHPHWPNRFPASYIKQVKKLTNVRLISPKISIHDILKGTSGVLTYNATTGIEALIYGKPVLSFASNIYYKHHSGVDNCNDLFELGKKLSQLINRKVNNEETIHYIYKLKKNSISFNLNSGNFFPKEDAASKASMFSKFLIAAIRKVNNA